MSSTFLPLGFITEVAPHSVLSVRSVVDRACVFDRLVVGVGQGLLVYDVAWGPEAAGEYVDGWAFDIRNKQRVFSVAPPVELFGAQYTGPEWEEHGCLYAFRRALPEHVRRIERLESVRITLRNTTNEPQPFNGAVLVELVDEEQRAKTLRDLRSNAEWLGAMVRAGHEKRRAAGHPVASGRSHEAPASSVSTVEGLPSSKNAAAGISTARDAAPFDAWPVSPPVDRDALRQHFASVRGQPLPARPRADGVVYGAEQWEQASDAQRVEILRRVIDCAAVVLSHPCADETDYAETNDSAYELLSEVRDFIGQGDELPGDENSDGAPIDVEWGPR